MRIKEFLKPTKWKIIIALVLMFLIPGIFQTFIYHKIAAPTEEVITELPEDLERPEAEKPFDIMDLLAPLFGLLLILLVYIEKFIYAYLIVCTGSYLVEKWKK